MAKYEWGLIQLCEEGGEDTDLLIAMDKAVSVDDDGTIVMLGSEFVVGTIYDFRNEPNKMLTDLPEGCYVIISGDEDIVAVCEILRKQEESE